MKILRQYYIAKMLLLFLFCTPVAAQTLKGTASWYGKEQAGRKMANGEVFDPSKMTAASYDLPLGTKCQVINMQNGRSVWVTITDRGPNHRLHRLIDVSERAAYRLGFHEAGLTQVQIRIGGKL